MVFESRIRYIGNANIGVKQLSRFDDKRNLGSWRLALSSPNRSHQPQRTIPATSLGLRSPLNSDAKVRSHSTPNIRTLPSSPASTSSSHSLKPEPNRTLSAAQLKLVRLTLSPEYSPPTTLPKRNPHCKRRLPKYPLDATDSSGLWKWLHTLRLHKYEKNLQGLTPRELLHLDEEELKQRGVDTVGARNKLLVVCSTPGYMNPLLTFSIRLSERRKSR